MVCFTLCGKPLCLTESISLRDDLYVFCQVKLGFGYPG